jgi:hypothetical protein
VIGKADVVEFHRAAQGSFLFEGGRGGAGAGGKQTRLRVPIHALGGIVCLRDYLDSEGTAPVQLAVVQRDRCLHEARAAASVDVLRSAEAGSAFNSRPPCGGVD